MSRPRVVRVRVPASSANLGPGFDALGLALGCYDQVEAAVAGDGLVVEVHGAGADTVPRDGRHLVVRSMLAAFEALGEPAPAGLRVRCRNAIPHRRGMGSSAAAAVAGAAAAAALAGRELAAERSTLLQLTASMEGHADNAAASLLGGFVIAWTSDGSSNQTSGVHNSVGNNGMHYDAVRLDAHPSLRPVLLIATSESSTATTRGLLPAEVPLADAAFTGSRTALAVHAFTARPELLMVATEDRLHQGYRRPAYPRSAELVDELRAAGVPATISGAGPSVLAVLVAGAPPQQVPNGLVGAAFTVCPLAVDTDGVQVERG